MIAFAAASVGTKQLKKSYKKKLVKQFRIRGPRVYRIQGLRRGAFSGAEIQ